MKELVCFVGLLMAIFAIPWVRPRFFLGLMTAVFVFALAGCAHEQKPCAPGQYVAYENNKFVCKTAPPPVPAKPAGPCVVFSTYVSTGECWQ